MPITIGNLILLPKISSSHDIHGIGNLLLDYLPNILTKEQIDFVCLFFCFFFPSVFDL